MKKIKEITIYGRKNPTTFNQTSSILFNIDGMKPKEIEHLLHDKYNIITKAGLHCTACTHH